MPNSSQSMISPFFPPFNQFKNKNVLNTTSNILQFVWILTVIKMNLFKGVDKELFACQFCFREFKHMHSS